MFVAHKIVQQNVVSIGGRRENLLLGYIWSWIMLSFGFYFGHILVEFVVDTSLKGNYVDS